MEFTGERFIPNKTDVELEQEHFIRYIFARQFVKDKVVLDAACGEGYGSNILSIDSKEVYGIDISDEAIEEANKKYNDKNIKYIKSDIAKMVFEDKKFDIVISFETIEHINETLQERFLEEVKRVLKNDGILIISTPNKKVYSDKYNYHNEFHEKEFYRDEFISFLQKYFVNVELCDQYCELVNIIKNKNNSKAYDDSNILIDDISKYYVAICSNKDINKDYYSIYRTMPNDNYANIIDRILLLQKEVEDRNAHISKLDEEIKVSNKEIERLNSRIDELSKWGTKLDLENKKIAFNVEEYKKNIKEKEKLNENNLEIISKLNEKLYNNQQEINNLLKINDDLKNKIIKNEIIITEGKKEILDLNQKIDQQEVKFENEINNKTAHIDVLLERDRELERIHNSVFWKVFVVLNKIKSIIFPENSKRLFVAQVMRKVINNPKVYMRKISKSGEFIKHIVKEDISQLNNRMDKFEEVNIPVENEKLKIVLSQDTKEYEKIEFNYEENPLVTIIIPVYNQWNYTYHCLKSIKENTQDVKYEIIIADDVSMDETKDIQNYIANINVIRNETNLGFLLNCNNAAKRARGKYIHFLNNDTNVQKNWLSSLVSLIESSNDIGMVGSKLVYPNGKLQEAGGIIWNDASGWNYGRLDDPEKPEYNYVKEVDYISGASILIKKSLWEEIGGFDKRYVPAYFEDSDLAFEVRHKNYKVMFQPLSIVVHFEGISNGTDENTGIKSYQVVNKDKFTRKWNEILRNKHFKNAEDVFLARDKSKNKKTILVIDHYVPHYDKDAGSRTVFQYLKMFINKGFNVKFIGDNFFKHEPYTTTLQQLGIEVLYGSYYMSNWKQWIKTNRKYLDIVFLNRPHITMNYIDYIKEYTDARIIYYGHDLHFLREYREYEITRDRQILENSKKTKINEFKIMRKADVIYYPSEVEVNEIKKEDNTIDVKAISAYIFPKEKIKNYTMNTKKDLMFIGGFNHGPNVDGIKWFVEEIFEIVLKKYPNMKLYIIGSNAPEDILKLNSENIIVVGYVTDEQLVEYYQKCRIDVVPLRYGAGIKGKVVEAMYYGIPIITTSIGAEGLKNSNEFLGIGDTKEEFANEIITLYNDEKKLKEMSCKAKVYINDNFTEDSAFNIIEQDFS